MLIALVFTHLPALITPNVLNVLGYYKNKAPFEPFFMIFVTLNGLLNPLINFARNETLPEIVSWIIWISTPCKVGPEDSRGRRTDTKKGQRVCLMIPEMPLAPQKHYV